MYGYIYLTTNLVNGKQYIGKHKSDKFEPDTYIGSGKLLKQAIEKYGKENFKCDLLGFCETLDELNLKEQYYIDLYDAVLNENFYNIAAGGDGGDHSQYIDYSKSRLRYGKDNFNYQKNYKWINDGKVDKKLFEGEELPENFMYGRAYKASDNLKIYLSDMHKGKSPTNKGKQMSNDQKLKVSQSRKGKCLGSSNPSKRPDVKEKLSKRYICPYCNNYISTKSCVHRHINKNHILESATTIENIDWEKYSVEEVSRVGLK